MNQPNFSLQMLAKGKARIEIYDAIGPSWAGMIDTKLVAQKLKDAGELSEIEVRLNSPGGSAYDGIAIHNVLKEHPAKVTVVVDGVAASAASVIAMAGDVIRIPKNGMLMIHEPATFAFGTKDDLLKSVAQLDSMLTASIETYAAKSGQAAEKIAQWMKDETWFTGQEAVDAGFATTTEKELPLAKVEPKASVQQMYANAPSQFASLFALTMSAKPQEPEMADQVPETIVETPAAPAAPAVPVLTAADVKAAADKSVADERARIAGVMSVCQKAGKADMANEFIANGTSLSDVQNRMFEVLCAARPPIGDAGGNDAPATQDPDAASKAEYAADRVLLQRAGISEEDYVISRRISAGTEQLITR